MDAPEHLGKWATDRVNAWLSKHPGDVVPGKIVTWLDTNGPRPAGKDTPPTALALGWLVSVLVDPDWGVLQRSGTTMNSSSSGGTTPKDPAPPPDTDCAPRAEPPA